MPNAIEAIQYEIAELATKAWAAKRKLDTAAENSHAFELPAVVQFYERSLTHSAAGWLKSVKDAEAMLTAIQSDIDDRCFDLYSFSADDRVAVAASARENRVDSEGTNVEDDGEAETIEVDALSLAADLISWLLGVAFGRFDVRLATGKRSMPSWPKPFDSLSSCSPGMLTNSDGQPCKTPPADYPISWRADGLLVDDAETGGVSAGEDIVRRMRQVIEVVWRDKAADIEQELCGLLGARNLREYLRKPSGFFDHHLKRYSKSRRKAPIYWPLSTPFGEYTVWAYYPRLTTDMLYKAVSEYVAPKIAKVEDRIGQLEGGEARREGREGARAAKELVELSEFLSELKHMREELLRVAKLSYKPNLNDGVQITAAPLWRLFRLPRWRSELEKTWKALEKGEYDWAHLSYAIWPDRVKENCKTDKSLAIAHGLESLYQEPQRQGEGKSGRRAKRGGGR
jgi:hypothetical protein